MLLQLLQLPVPRLLLGLCRCVPLLPLSPPPLRTCLELSPNSMHLALPNPCVHPLAESLLLSLRRRRRQTQRPVQLREVRGAGVARQLIDR
jgi:hypothetical protein